MTELTVVLLGCPQVGKTALAQQFVSKSFPDEYHPTLDDLYSTKIEVEKKTYTINIYDTSGSQDADHTLQLQKAQVAIIVYDVTGKNTFDKLLDINSKITQDIPKLLVANKSDVEKRQVTKAQGIAVAKHLNCHYMEACANNAKPDVGQASSVFEAAVLLLSNPKALKPTGGGGCCTIS